MKKKIILTILSIALVGASGLLFVTLQSENKSDKTSVNSNIENETSKDKETASSDKKNDSDNKEIDTKEQEETNRDSIKEDKNISKEIVKAETPISFTNGLTRENLNGYYKIIRDDGGIGYGKLTNEGLFTLDQRPSGVVLTNTDKFTPKSTDGENKYEFQINGEMTNSSFTVKDENELYVNLPNFGDIENYTYKRISQNEYEDGAKELVVRENKFSTIGDYYFGNQGQVGTMSSIEDTIEINNKKYKVVKSLNSGEKVLISLFGQTYNYNEYKSTGLLVIDNSNMFSGFN